MELITVVSVTKSTTPAPRGKDLISRCHQMSMNPLNAAEENGMTEENTLPTPYITQTRKRLFRAVLRGFLKRKILSSDL